MHGELNWNYIDQVVECYATVSAYREQFPELERQIVEICEGIAARRPAMQDFSYLLNRAPQMKEEVLRKIAWASQHIFSARAWCVGQKVVLCRRGQESESPLISQLRRLGYRSSAIDIAHVQNGWNDIPKQDRLDALLLNAKQDTVYLIKGASYSQAKKQSPELWVNADRTSLFGKDGRFLSRLFVRSDALACLLFARDLVAPSFPDLKVKCVFLTIDDVECSWRFQAQDVSALDPRSLQGARQSIDKCDVNATHFDLAELFEQDSDAFASLPNWTASDYLHAAPVDRPTRSIMVLNEMWKRQAGQTSKLVAHRAVDLAEYVQETYRVEYPTDLWRHDIEDCLERGRFIQRVGDGRNAYAILPKGVARMLLIGRRFNPLVHLSAGKLLGSVTAQAKLWAVAPAL